ncbi:hypothetical protein [Dactylosporangium sp. CA-092794]|uniref:hypothetical protein n=1 Tax=Dactylosporangium sp. CA-092794 TaxID=3239929 RepID=UPI003D903F96
MIAETSGRCAVLRGGRAEQVEADAAGDRGLFTRASETLRLSGIDPSDFETTARIREDADR